MHLAVHGVWSFLRRLVAWTTTGAVVTFTAYFMVTRPALFLMNFATYAVISLASEAFFTGFTVQIRRRRRGEPIDWRLPCQPFLWSLIVYGLSAAISFPLLETAYPTFFHWPWFARGFGYMFGIYFWEYYWGWRIEDLTGTVPWKYRESPWRIWRYVNPYYAWSWFCYGFVLEFVHQRLIPALPGIFAGFP